MSQRIKEMAAKLEEAKALLEKAAKPKHNAGELFTPSTDVGFSSDWRKDPWPEKRLQRLAKSYNHEAAVSMLARDGQGRPRGIGWGQALVKMACVASPAAAASFGGWTQESLEKDGFITVHKAKEHGIKGLDGVVRKTALAEGSGQTGGYIVPPQFMNELNTIAAEDAFIEPRAKVVPMTSRTLTWPMLDITTPQSTGTSPYFGGILAQWQPEAASINESEPQFRQTEWTAWDLVLYTVSSNQLLADNGIGLDALLTQLFGSAITWYKEYAFLRGLGAGSSMPMGILNAPATYVQSRTTANQFKLADAAAMMSRCQIRSWDTACWVMHPSVLPQLIQMVDNTTSNRLVWMTPFGDGKVGGAAMKLPTLFLNGLAVYFTEKLPTLGTKGDVMLVDFSRYVIGNRLDMQIDVSPHYLFRNNQLAWRVVARCDGKPWLNNVITDASGWVSSPFVVLNAG